jgi:hypothetical protein
MRVRKVVKIERIGRKFVQRNVNSQISSSFYISGVYILPPQLAKDRKSFLDEREIF